MVNPIEFARFQGNMLDNFVVGVTKVRRQNHGFIVMDDFIPRVYKTPVYYPKQPNGKPRPWWVKQNLKHQAKQLRRA